MSWSVNVTGRAELVAQKLEEYKGSLTGQSLAEYEAVLPSLLVLVKANNNSSGVSFIRMNANGSGSADGSYSSCNVKIENEYGVLV